jgi:hypothetical protein
VSFIFIFIDLHHESVSEQRELATLVIAAELNNSDALADEIRALFAFRPLQGYIVLTDETFIPDLSFILSPARAPPERAFTM